MPSRLRRFAIRALVACAAVVAVDVAISLLLIRDGRIFGRLLPPNPPTTSERFQDWVAEQRGELAKPPDLRDSGIFDRELGWTHRAGFTSRDGKRHYNSLGARGGREYAGAPPPGVLRIATFGESFTHCAQVPEEHSFQAQMEARRADVEALNFGVNGYGQDQALLRFRREGRSLGAHVMTMGLMLENIGRNVNRSRLLWTRLTHTPGPKPRFLLRDGRLELVPQPFGSLEELLAAIEEGRYDARLVEHESWLDPELPTWAWRSSLVRLGAGWLASRRRSVRGQWRDVEGEPFRVTLAILEAFHREATEAGARLAPVLIWGLESDVRRLAQDGDLYWQPLLDELDRRGIPWLDLIEPLAAAYPSSLGSGRRSLYGGTHLSREGNAVVARALLGCLESRGLLAKR